MTTMSALIQQALGNDEPIDAPDTVQIEKTAAPQSERSSSSSDLVSVLRYIGSHGIEKVASDMMPETNAGYRMSEHVQSQVGHNRNSGDMVDDGGMMPGNNAGVMHSGPADLQSMGHGSHHPSLASNDAAINYTKREKSKHVSGQLKHLLSRAVPFADPKVKENLDTTAADPNINKAGAGLSTGGMASKGLKAALAKKCRS